MHPRPLFAPFAFPLSGPSSSETRLPFTPATQQPKGDWERKLEDDWKLGIWREWPQMIMAATIERVEEEEQEEKEVREQRQGGEWKESGYGGESEDA